MGIPARYASGYLHPHSDAAVDNAVAGQSHAWLEARLGDWHGVDPTNGTAVASQHVLVARGRDYGDVPPLEGIYNGGPGDVQVEITRVA
jgi:transglutaminase-like putative cysteine protease